jgi:zinc protease
VRSWAIGVVVSLALVASASAQSRSNWPSERPPRPLPARDVTFPPYQIQTLPNGLQVVVVLHHEQPAVSLRLLVRTGSASDPKDKLGLVHELASLLDQGTETQSASQLNDAIDSIGGAAGAGAAADVTHLNMVVMKDSFESGLRMLSEMTRHPAFAQAEIARQQQQTISGLRVSLEDPDYVADAVFDRLVYGFHPYGLPHTGTPTSIDTITRDDLIAFHQKYFAPNNAILAVVGDVNAEEAFDGVKKVFGDWARKEIAVEKFIEPPSPTRRLVVVNKPDAVQTEVRVGHIGIERTHRDYMALNLAIRILGGEGSNRLHNILRTQRGLTYGAQANMETHKESGDFVAQTNTRSEATAEVLRLTFDEFWRLQRETVSERELADAKAYMTGSFPLTIETPEAIAMQVLNVVFYGLPIEELQNYRERVNAVTVDDIQRVARAYLRPDRLSVVLVGNVAAFGSQLKGVGFNSYETVELGALDLTMADFKGSAGRSGAAAQPRFRSTRHLLRPESWRMNQVFGGPALESVLVSAAERPPIAPRVQEGPPAKALLDRMIMAMGGLRALRAVTRITAKTTTSLVGPQGQIQAEATTYLEYPNRVRVETKLPAATTVQVYDGTHAWVRDAAGVHDVPDPLVRDLEVSLQRDPIALLLAAERGTIRSRLLPRIKSADGAEREALELWGEHLDPVVLDPDPKTGLVARQSYAAGGAGKPLIEEVFSDYRPIDGVQVPHVVTVRRGGQAMLERRVSAISINPSLPASLFTRPAL